MRAIEALTLAVVLALGIGGGIMLGNVGYDLWAEAHYAEPFEPGPGACYLGDPA